MPDVPEHIYKILRDNFPLICTDGVVVNEKHILLVKRLIKPFKGYWTLPGGHVDFGERLEEAVCREVLEETGVITRVIGLIDIFAQPDRDPWGHIISIAFLLTLNDSQSESNNFDLNEVGYWKWFSINKLPKKIGFDHIEMIKKAQIKYPKHF